ncbi:MAG: isoprenyl transferase [Proteobacteria bacterium]|nr:isoprenyl transferase [Pseudomonadota bacterium]
MQNIEINKLPTHVAIIMDGNGRWAKLRNLPRVEGHLQGMESVRDVVTTTRNLKIPYLTLYAFSKENWTRSEDEVKRLLEILGVYLQNELPLMMDKNIRFNVVGNLKDFPKRLQHHIKDVMDKTAGNTSLTLSIALSYSGREEIVNAVKLILEDAKKGAVKRINENVFSRYLYTRNMPDPDLLIRTSGEMRISNFLLWQIAYTELYVTDTLWPDFGKEAYIEALKAYTRRERRFGSTK